MDSRYQVVIVGGGPVGVSLAIELGQRGISCALVERHLEPQRIPKGQNLTNRSMELFYFWRCLDELRAARVLPPGYPIGGVTAYGNLMGEYWYSTSGGGSRGPAVQDYFFQKNERLPQYCTEQVLRDRLAELPSVTALFGWTAEQVEQDNHGVRVAIAPAREGADPSDGLSADIQGDSDQDMPADTGQSPESQDHEAQILEAQILEAQYLVGCDGGRSLVRERIGIERSGRNFDQRMLLAVFRSRELHEGLKRFPDCTTYRVLKPELQGYWQFFGRVDVGEGFFFHAPIPQDARPDNYDFHRLLHEAAGFNFAAEFDYVGFWDLRVMVASQYRNGRVFIAGDAAHQHPPYGGFGLNTGLEDAVNLGWKLAARLQGWGGEALLDAYDEERRPIFVETGEAMIAGGIERDRAFLERYHPERDREEFERAWGVLTGTSADIPTQLYEPHYEGSSVVIGPPDGVCSILGTYAHAARPGHHLSPRRLSSGRNVFEELGSGFTLLAFDVDDEAVRAFEETARSLRIPLEVVRDSFEAEREAYESRLVLVRPDQYVAWSGNEVPEELQDLMRTVVGIS